MCDDTRKLRLIQLYADTLWQVGPTTNHVHLISPGNWTTEKQTKGGKAKCHGQWLPLRCKFNKQEYSGRKTACCQLDAKHTCKLQAHVKEEEDWLFVRLIRTDDSQNAPESWFISTNDWCINGRYVNKSFPANYFRSSEVVRHVMQHVTYFQQCPP